MNYDFWWFCMWFYINIFAFKTGIAQYKDNSKIHATNLKFYFFYLEEHWIENNKHYDMSRERLQMTGKISYLILLLNGTLFSSFLNKGLHIFILYWVPQIMKMAH